MYIISLLQFSLAKAAGYPPQQSGSAPTASSGPQPAPPYGAPPPYSANAPPSGQYYPSPQSYQHPGPPGANFAPPPQGYPQGVPPGAGYQPPPQGYPQGYPGGPQPQTVMVQGGFDAGARFSGTNPPNIPVSLCCAITLSRKSS